MADSRAAARLILLVFPVMLLGMVVFRAPILESVGSLVVESNALPDKIDAVIVLAGSVPDRAEEAVALWEEKEVGEIWVEVDVPGAGAQKVRDLGIQLPMAHEINLQFLIKKGVPARRIKQVAQTTSTHEDAKGTREYVDQLAEPVDSLVVVTCRYHSYRAGLNFRRELAGTNVKLYVRPSRYCGYHESRWWQHRDSLKAGLLELAGLVAFSVGYR